MAYEPPLLLALDLTGTFAFALNGALTAIKAVRLDIVGVISLGVVTAIGGGIIRDVLIGALPPATFADWRYLTVAVAGALVAFLAGRHLVRWNKPIVLLDAAGLSLFAVTGTSKALAFGLGIGPAIILGAITAVGGGTVRDMMIRRVPTILTSGLYAIPALLAATVTAAAIRLDIYGIVAAIVAAAACFVLRVLGVKFGWNAPHPRG